MAAEGVQERGKESIHDYDNKKEMRTLKSVVATMAIENMYFDEAFINEMIKVSRGEKTTEDIIREIILEYGR